MCWRGSPASRCHGYLISEAGIRTASDISGTFTVGLMANTAEARAWGLSGGFAVGADDNVSVVGLIRHRHWLGRRKAIDMAVGPVFTRWHDAEDGRLDRRAWDGVTALVAYSYADLAALTLEFDTGNATPVMIGFRTGSYVGAAIAMLGVIGLSQY